MQMSDNVIISNYYNNNVVVFYLDIQDIFSLNVFVLFFSYHPMQIRMLLVVTLYAGSIQSRA